jgi:hypothetical protein
LKTNIIHRSAFWVDYAAHFQKILKMSVASSDAFPQKGLAWTILTSPVFISKPSVP